MNQHLPGLFIISFLVAVMACVPVDEKKEVQFDIGLENSLIRRIYNMQTRHDKDSLLLFLQDADPSARFAAARAFASFHDTTVLDLLYPLLKDPDGRVRAMAAEAVGLIGSPRSEAQLIESFDGRDSARLYGEANSAILEAMGRVGSTQYLHALSTISNYQHIDTLLLLGQVRGIYRYALRDMTDPEGTATMIKYFSDTGIPFEVRVMSANYLQRAPNLNLTPHNDQLLALWRIESDPYMRMCLATALGKLKTNNARDVLIESLQTEVDYRVKCNILRALQSFQYDDVSSILLEFAKSTHPAIAEVAAQYFVNQGKEKDAAKYKAAIDQCKTWESKSRLAEAANKNMTSIFTPAKESLQKDIQLYLTKSNNVYEKAAWLKAWGSEIRNFESIPKYITADQHVVIRSQAVQSLIDATKDKNFDAYFAGEGHLIRSQIGGYLANAMRTGDAGVLALIAGAIIDPRTGLKEVLRDQKTELSKAMANLELPTEMETYLELAKALEAYEISSPPIPEEKKSVKQTDWGIVDKLTTSSKVRMTTSQGDIHLELYPERAPGSVANFIQLAEENFFDSKPFHRVVPNFVIQAGCPRGDGWGGPGYVIHSEFTPLTYEEGYVGMASAGKDTEGSQWFITHSIQPHLDG